MCLRDRMLTIYSLDQLTRDLDALVAECADEPAAIPALARPLLERLLRDPAFEPAALPEQRGRALLHRHPDGLYTVWSMLFPPSEPTPVHDHNTWGLVGVWRGEEREEKFHRTDDGRRAGYATLETRGSTVNTPGKVTLLVPPRDDIHRIWNPTSEPAYSIHIYGQLLGTWRASTFDLDTG